MHQTWLNTSRAKKKTITLSKNALIYESVLYHIFIHRSGYRFAGQDKIKIKILFISIGLDSCVCHSVVLQFPKERYYKRISIALTLQQQEH